MYRLSIFLMLFFKNTSSAFRSCLYAPMSFPKISRLAASTDSSSTTTSATPPSPERQQQQQQQQQQQHAAETVIDRSTLQLLEHVNLNVPEHKYMIPFYFDILGCGLDPRKAENMAHDASKKTIWANCGASQFHLPYGEVAQCIPGQIGLRYDSLQPLKQRIAAAMQKSNPDACFAQCDVQDDLVRLVDRYDNVFYCRQGGNPVADKTWKQPVIKPTDTERWGEVAERYGMEDSDCRGIDYVEFSCPRGTADKIALFYDAVLDATTDVVESRGDNVAVIAFGNVYDSGRADQALLFRETDNEIPLYDGHHVAMYVGESAADFEQAFKNAEMAGVVWVNPRFTDKATNLQGAKKWNQFRFKDIVDMNTGKKILELEHEMRSVEHEAWPGRHAN